VNGKMRKNKQIGACPFVGKADNYFCIVLAFLQSGSKHLSFKFFGSFFEKRMKKIISFQTKK